MPTRERLNEFIAVVESGDHAGAIERYEGDNVAIHWIFELTDKSGNVRRVDEVALQQWRGEKIFRERFFYDPSRPKT